MARDQLRHIPPIDRLLAEVEVEFGDAPRSLLVRALRQVVADVRGQVEAGTGGPGAGVDGYFGNGDFRRDLRRQLHALQQPRHRPLINATGVLLHTGLGRAPLSREAQAAVQRMAGYGIVEVDPTTGLRGRRETFVRDLLVELTGAEEAIVVNNNAAAVMLLLRGLARDREVIVSRGELVEIGGGFRVPAVMEESGARLREVGTTNRTRIADYRAALGERTGLLLRVHTSNFKIVGFTEAPTFEELVELGAEAGVAAAADLGSGYLRRLPRCPFPDEPSVSEAVQSGLDVVTFSGDKMLGGPQCGVLVGRSDAIVRLRREPLFRALRPDKLTLAALEATLLLWRQAPDGPPRGIPFYDRLLTPQSTLEERADLLLGSLLCAGVRASRVHSQGQVGSGSVPGLSLPSRAVALHAPGGQADQLATRLRVGEPSVFARVKDDCVLLDLLAVSPEELEPLGAAAQAAFPTE